MHPDAAALPQPPDPPPVLGVNLAKNVFQVCMTAAGGQPPRNRTYSRDNFMKLLGRLPPGSTVAFEACGSCHYWARYCTALGLTVRVIPASVIHSLNMASRMTAAMP